MLAFLSAATVLQIDIATLLSSSFPIYEPRIRDGKLSEDMTPSGQNMIIVHATCSKRGKSERAFLVPIIYFFGVGGDANLSDY